MTFKKRILNFHDYLTLQDGTNELTLAGWKDKLSPDHYAVAILDEASEFLGSGVGWRWWKKAPGNFDEWNAKIEVVDILHFALSIYILNFRDQAFSEGQKQILLGYMPAAQDEPFMNSDGTLNHTPFISAMTALMDPFVSVDDIHRLVEGMQMLPEEISAVFLAKCTLNRIRQDQGYKTGEYQKVRDGIEDNVRLQEVVEYFLRDDQLTLDDVYKGVYEEFTTVTFED